MLTRSLGVKYIFYDKAAIYESIIIQLSITQSWKRRFSLFQHEESESITSELEYSFREKRIDEVVNQWGIICLQCSQLTSRGGSRHLLTGDQRAGAQPCNTGRKAPFKIKRPANLKYSVQVRIFQKSLLCLRTFRKVAIFFKCSMFSLIEGSEVRGARIYTEFSEADINRYSVLSAINHIKL